MRKWIAFSPEAWGPWTTGDIADMPRRREKDFAPAPLCLTKLPLVTLAGFNV